MRAWCKNKYYNAACTIYVYELDDIGNFVL